MVQSFGVKGREPKNKRKAETEIDIQHMLSGFGLWVESDDEDDIFDVKMEVTLPDHSPFRM